MGPTPNGFRTAQPTVGATATLICAARADRGPVTIINHGTTDVFIGDANVTINNGALLNGAKGQAVTIHTTAAIYGIVAAATQAVGVIETFS
jgi:UDP-N-acetylglucosamine enolpyruvyl transferase